jgi:hypothetical protein
MANKWKMAVVLVILCVGCIAMALIATIDHWWKKQGNAKVYLNGKFSAESSVYRSRKGDFLVKMEDGIYIVFLEHKEIGTANDSHFIVLPGYVYSRNVPPSFALMNPVKSVDPQLNIRVGSIEFNSSESLRVTVSLP